MHARHRKEKAAPPPPVLSLGDLDRLREDYFPLDRVPNLIPPLRRDRPVNVSTVYRWTNEGCKGVRLRYVTLASKRFTTREWLAEFFAAMNGQDAATEDARSMPEPDRESADDPAVDRKLDRFMGPKAGSRKRSKAKAMAEA
jgi:hypothetical protein